MKYCYPKFTHIVVLLKNKNDCVRAYALYNGYFIIDYFILDSTKVQNRFNNISFMSLHDYFNLKFKPLLVIYASEKDEIAEIADSLSKRNFVFGYEYTFSFILNNYNSIDLLTIGKLSNNADTFAQSLLLLAQGRKIFILNGNCQTDYLKQYLLSNNEFTNNYYYVHIPRIQVIQKIDIKYLEWLLPKCDYCYSQIISDTNRFCSFLSTNNIFKSLNKSCIKRTISNITFCGYYPQCSSEQWNYCDFLGEKFFAYGDRYIDEMLTKGYNPFDILEKIKKDDFIKKTEIISFFNEQVEITKKRDSKCNIKVFDYVEKFLNKKICFHSFNHPHNFIIRELSDRILRDLHISNIEYNNIERLDDSEKLRGESQVIYPCVLKALNLSARKDATYFINRRLLQLEPTFDDWVLHYCYFKKQTNKRINIDLWGSCIVDVIPKYGNDFNVGSYIFENPPSTSLSKKYTKGLIMKKSGSRWADINIHKKAEAMFNNTFKSTYLLIDFADIRFNYYESTANSSRISITRNFDANYSINEKYWKKTSSFNNSDEKIISELKKFGNLIFSKYKPENVVLCRTYFATKYFNKNFETRLLTKFKLYKNSERLIRKYENLFIKLYPNIKILDLGHEPMAAEKHSQGLSPLHYNSFEYYLLYAKLCSVLNHRISPKEI